MRFKCGYPIKEWLRSPVRTFVMYRRCVTNRIDMATRIDGIEVRHWAEDPKDFAEKYYHKPLLPKIKIQPKAEEGQSND